MATCSDPLIEVALQVEPTFAWPVGLIVNVTIAFVFFWLTVQTVSKYTWRSDPLHPSTPLSIVPFVWTVPYRTLWVAVHDTESHVVPAQ